jgi:hypothetical protein
VELYFDARMSRSVEGKVESGMARDLVAYLKTRRFRRRKSCRGEFSCVCLVR